MRVASPITALKHLAVRFGQDAVFLCKSAKKQTKMVPVDFWARSGPPDTEATESMRERLPQ